jgi:RNA-directed DNA polymerase
LGIAALEDKIVQRALVEVLNAIWEEDFLGFSYGFRPGRGQHDALDALAVGIDQRQVNWILDADIAGFFDTVSHDWLIKFVELRVGDRRVVRLIRKWLKAGVAEDGQVTPGEVGTPPASAGAGSRCGDLATAGQHLPALCLRSVGEPMAQAPCPRRRHHGAWSLPLA